MYAPNQARDFYKELGYLGKDFAKSAWAGIVAVDLLQKCLLSFRPYCKEAEEVYAHYLKLLEECIQGGGSLKRLLKRAAEDFGSLKREDGKRPILGVVGEIFVRANSFSNEDVIKRVEEFGGQVWVAPVYEWFLYRNFRRKMHSVAHKDFLCFLRTHLQHFLQSKVESVLSHLFEEAVEHVHEPSTEEVLHFASPYLPCTIEGEAVLSVGKAVDFIKKGAKGIINVMPFTCMPGTITTALLRKVQQDYNVPVLNIAYDGLGQANTLLRLEAFLHQLSSD
jgi:predicted nucleotide-binding protein (sugar kinase/HSP70/actin superfamily)